MAKELPYFKFYVGEWLLGRISDEKERIQGVFIKCCCYYWHNECDITYTKINKKLGKKNTDLLISLNFIEKKNDNICIQFLDEQRVELIDLHNKRSKSGKAGGQASVKQRLSKKEASFKHLDKEEIIKDKEEKEFVFNQKDEDFKNFLCKKFSISEITMFQKYTKIVNAINFKKNQGEKKDDWFRAQCYHYFKYKELSGDKVHTSIESFLGDLDQDLENGGWNSANWIEKHKEIEKKGNTQNSTVQPNSGKGSKIQPSNNKRTGLTSIKTIVK